MPFWQMAATGVRLARHGIHLDARQGGEELRWSIRGGRTPRPPGWWRRLQGRQGSHPGRSPQGAGRRVDLDRRAMRSNALPLATRQEPDPAPPCGPAPHERPSHRTRPSGTESERRSTQARACDSQFGTPGRGSIRNPQKRGWAQRIRPERKRRGGDVPTAGDRAGYNRSSQRLREERDSGIPTRLDSSWPCARKTRDEVPQASCRGQGETGAAHMGLEPARARDARSRGHDAQSREESQ